MTPIGDRVSTNVRGLAYRQCIHQGQYVFENSGLVQRSFSTQHYNHNLDHEPNLNSHAYPNPDLNPNPGITITLTVI